MIRWRYLITRLAIVSVVLMLLRWGLGPVVSYVTVQGLQKLTGAKVEIAETRVGFFPPRVQYLDVAVADPRDGKEMRDAFHADSIDLVIDGEALMQRRWVARDGRITGLQVGSDRESSGRLATTPVRDRTTGPSMLRKLLSAATDQIDDRAEQLVDELETVRQSREIRERWESEYAALKQRAETLEKLVRDIRDEARDVDNPLRDLPALSRTLDQAKSARDQLIDIRRAIDSLPDRVQSDLAQLDEAKQIDLAKVDRYVPGDLSNAEGFGVEIMTEAVRAHVARVRGYIDSGRELAEYTVVEPQRARVRGVDHDLLGPNRLPQLLIRRCEVSGLMRADGNAYVMTGIVENMTTDPEWLSEPTRTMLKLEGPELIRAEFVRDRRRGADRDQLTLHWPEMEAAEMRLGDADAAIALRGGRRELWVQIESRGEQIDGQLVSRQTGLTMQLDVDPKYAETPAAVSLQESLAAVDQVEVDARFAGTWSDVDVQLNTNLGQIFHHAAREAIAGQTRAFQAKMTAEIEREHLKQVVALRNWMGQRQGEARTLLASADKTIAELSQRVVNQLGQQDIYLGRLRAAIQDRLR
jgi:uncharacterized protein (TIGR03545 family)